MCPVPMLIQFFIMNLRMTGQGVNQDGYNETEGWLKVEKSDTG